MKLKHFRAAVCIAFLAANGIGVKNPFLGFILACGICAVVMFCTTAVVKKGQ